MKNYIGVKQIQAEPCSQDQFAGAKNKGDLSSLAGGIDTDGYRVIYEDDYVSWSPKDVFEKAYRETTGLTFGLAIEALKLGKKVARKGWNGKGMYLKLIQGYPVDSHLNPGNPTLTVVGEPQGKAGQMLSHIVMKTAGDSQYWGWGFSDYVPWLASQTDMLSEDWELIE